MQAMTGWLDLDLQLRLKHLEDEYFAVVLPHIEKSLDVVDAEAGGSVESAVGVDEFQRMFEVDAEYLDAVVAAVGDPDAPRRVDDERPRLVELVGVGARRGSVHVRHLLVVSVDETDAVQRAGSAGAAVTDDPGTLVDGHRTPRVFDGRRQVDAMDQLAARTELAQTTFGRVADQHVVVRRQRHATRSTVYWPLPVPTRHRRIQGYIFW